MISRLRSAFRLSLGLVLDSACNVNADLRQILKFSDFGVNDLRNSPDKPLVQIRQRFHHRNRHTIHSDYEDEWPGYVWCRIDMRDCREIRLEALGMSVRLQ